jgi:AcrR family transcriptional regulator
LRDAKICAPRKINATVGAMDNGGPAEQGRCPSHPPVPSLRERKKAETRETISRAAVKLALERGLENVRVPDIAAEADVSPRTYNNYFASIPEAICASAADRALALAAVVRARPASEPLAEAVANAIVEVVSHENLDRDLVGLIMHCPPLRGELFKAIVARDMALTQAIAERSGTDPGDLFPQILAAAYSGATRVAMHLWLRDEKADFPAILRAALDMIAPMAEARPAANAAANASPGSASAERKISGHPAPEPATLQRSA